MIVRFLDVRLMIEGFRTGAVISGAPVLMRDQEVEHPGSSTNSAGVIDTRKPGVTMPSREEAAALLRYGPIA